MKILLGTPWWVIALFCYLMYVGLKLGKTRLVPLKRLVFVPALFLIWSFFSLATKYPLNFFTTTCWSLSTLGGYYLGWYMLSKKPIAVDKNQKLILLPGSWLTLISFLLFFAGKYLFGATYALHPELRSSLLYTLPDIALSGIISGRQLGNLLCLIYKFKFTPHSDLQDFS